MNNKKKELDRIVEAVLSCCIIDYGNGVVSFTKEDLLGNSRAGNVVMSRCILASQIIMAGFSVTTASQVMNRKESSIRHLLEKDVEYMHNSRAYRIASSEATLKCKEIIDN